MSRWYSMGSTSLRASRGKSSISVLTPSCAVCKSVPASGSISAQGRATVHNPEWIVPKKVRIVSASDNWTNRKPNLTGQVEGKTVRFFADWPSDSADGVVEMHVPPATKIPTKTEQQKILITPKRHRFEMELADGKTVSVRCEHSRGAPENPLTRAEIEEKFRQYAKGVLPAPRIDEAIAAINGLENLKSVRGLMDILRTGKEQRALKSA